MNNIVFMGTPSYATFILKALIANDKMNILAIFTQPDKPVGRKKLLKAPHVKQYLLDNNIDIPIYQPLSLKDEYSYKIIDKLNPDVIVVAAYGQILPQNILNRAKCINLHASILPKYRGASPIQDTILNNDQYSGVTAMIMDSGLDTGDIIGFSYVKIDNDIKVDRLFDLLSKMASNLIIKVLLKSNLKQYAQNNALATKCSKIDKKDALVSFDNAFELYLKFKAYYGWPTVYLENGLKLLDIQLVDTKKINNSGEIIGIDSDGIVIGCNKGSIKIITLQPKSKKPMNALDYIRGKRLGLHQVFYTK